jgi:hypothetical protein
MLITVYLADDKSIEEFLVDELQSVKLWVRRWTNKKYCCFYKNLYTARERIAATRIELRPEEGQNVFSRNTNIFCNLISYYQVLQRTAQGYTGTQGKGLHPMVFSIDKHTQTFDAARLLALPRWYYRVVNIITTPRNYALLGSYYA